MSQADGRHCSELAVLGAGMMGGALLSALVAAGQDPRSVRATTLDPAAAQRLHTELGVHTSDDNVAAVQGADVVILAVKPGSVAAVLAEIGPHLAPEALVISVCAGVSTAVLQAGLPEGARVVRVMPNTPALLREGMCVLSGGSSCPPDQMERAADLLRSCGVVRIVPEGQQDAVTGVSGSGPAYLFYLAEAMIEAGVVLGLARADATELAVQTLYGAATMLRRGSIHPSLLREQVTSPGGTTAAALRSLDAHGVRAAVIDAIETAARRSAELSGPAEPST